MEKIVIRKKDGNIIEVTEVNDFIISGNHLIISTKEIVDGETDKPLVLLGYTVYDLALIESYARIIPTRKIPNKIEKEDESN